MPKGRPRKSTKLLLFEGKSHRTKAEIEQRKAEEVHIGDQHFRAPDYIASDDIAYAKWKEVIKLYKSAETQGTISSADTDIIAQYCQTFSEQRMMIEEYKKAKTAKGKRKLNTALLKNREMILKIQDRIYWNPVARSKGMSRKKKEEIDPLQKVGFGDI